jgi:hypothetical protein
MRSSNLQIKHIVIGDFSFLRKVPKNSNNLLTPGVIRIDDIYLWKKEYHVAFTQNRHRYFGEWKHMRNNLIIK